MTTHRKHTTGREAVGWYLLGFAWGAFIVLAVQGLAGWLA